MDWFAQFDRYCERTDLTYWSEPVNAITNAAFMMAAIFMAGRTHSHFPSQLLCLILFVIGTGSYLFHTHATAWAALSDVAPIGAFILTHLFLVNLHVLALPRRVAVIATAAFVPYAALLLPILDSIPFIRISNFYWTVPLLLVAYGIGLRRRKPRFARGLFTGAAILTISIIARSLDEILCPAFPLGTHFAWHCLNAIMLGYMIHVYHTHVLADSSTRR